MNLREHDFVVVKRVSGQVCDACLRGSVGQT